MRLALHAIRPHLDAMNNLHSDNPEHGFQFPGVFQLAAMGSADKHLEFELPQHLQAAGIEVLHESVNWRHSANGKFVSVRISFRAATRGDYERAHQALRDHPEVKWTL